MSDVDPAQVPPQNPTHPEVAAAPADAEPEGGIASRLPWGAEKERVNFPDNIKIHTNAKPGEFVVKTLFAEFTALAEKKIEQVLDAGYSDHQKPLCKHLQRGEDPNFDQLLLSLSSVAEHCLPSLLRTLFDWYEKQSIAKDIAAKQLKQQNRNKSEKDNSLDRRDNTQILEKREFAVNFIYCLVLIEVLKQLPYHPGYDDLVNHILTQSFRHFRYTEGGPVVSESGSSSNNVIADLYAEVICILAQSRFGAVKKRFMAELKELRSKEPSPSTTNSIICLLMGMKFFRVKMHPIEEFQASIQFIQECGHYFLEVKDRDIKHALAGLFVEILLPVAAVVKNEVNVPVLKNFVENMYSATLDISNKKKHSLALFPMVTCLLCVSQKQFFLNNWPYFLTIILSHLKDKDPKMARVALESLYRLVWVYMIRIKCESNTATTSRLNTIVNSLFPKGSKGIVVPRDTPLNIFVKIIQFIAQERLEFAMREIIFDLLCVGRQKDIKNLAPERMSIGLRAFLVVADSLQQKEGDPPMPQTMGIMPSGNTLRYKKTFINKYLSDAQARTIGMAAYYQHVRKAFDSILRLLDIQVGKPLLRTKTECVNREPEELITGERKPKIDLFRTCVAAIPRLLPDGMTQFELIDLLSRLTIHIDDELGKLAFQSLQNMIVDLPQWRNDVVRGFVQFIQKEVTDSFPQLLDQCSRRLISILAQWRTCGNPTNLPKESTTATSRLGVHIGKMPDQQSSKLTLHEVEGLALVLLCSCKPILRKLAGVVLKEVRNLFNLLEISQEMEPCVLDVMDRSCPVVIEKFLPHLPLPEKTAALSAPSLDFQWLADRTSIIWTSAGYHDINESSSTNNEADASRAWIECMSIFMHQDYVMGYCPAAVASAWPILYQRLHTLFKEHLDPNTTQNERTSSILGRPGSKKVTNERDLYMSLWQNYVVMGCCIAPSSQASDQRSASPDLHQSCLSDLTSTLGSLTPYKSNNSPDSATGPEAAPKSPGASSSAKDLFKLLVPLIRCEITDMMEAVVTGLGYINPEAFRDLVEELLPIIKEAIDRKQENVRRRKRRDILRLALVKIFKSMAENGIFAQSPAGVIEHNNALNSTFVEYIEGARLFLEIEGEKDLPVLQEIRYNYSEFIRHLIRNTSVEKRGSLLSRELRYSLFYLFARWSGKFGQTFGASLDRRGNRDYYCTELELSAVQAMSAVLCCGPVFDPTGLNDDGYIYQWLDTLLGAVDEKIYKLSQETVVLLLEFNPDAQALLEWVIDRCYTGSHEVADGCFNALAVVFSNKEYPCDHVSMLNVTLLNTGCPRVSVQETAVQLLRLLYKRFFLDTIIVTDPDGPGERGEGDGVEEGEVDYSDISHAEREERAALQELLLSGAYSQAQFFLSETLARLHPDLTMPMFSEITQRFQTAKPAIRQSLLQYLLPWLHNVELVDPNLQQINSPINSLHKLPDDHADYIPPPLKGEGWGSPQATEMVLNNLLYITAKFGDDHAKEIEDLWAALVACRLNNLKVIIRYIIISTGTSPTNLLPYTKRIIVYLGHAKPERLVDEMMVELQTVEALTFNVERTQTPPYYRFTKKPHQQAEEASALPEAAQYTPQQLVLDKGHITTKRMSGEDQANKLQPDPVEVTARTNSTASLRSEASTTSSIAPSVKTDTFCVGEMEELLAVPKAVAAENRRSISPVPYPLPMPAYGGYFAPIYELLPAADLPNPPYQRCNIAVMLLADLVVDGICIDWTVHLPLMLHIIFLGLDHSRTLVHEHCKKLLLNLLLVLSAHNDHFAVARIILCNKAINEDTALTLPNTFQKQVKDIGLVDNLEASGEGIPSQSVSMTSSGTLATDSVSSLVDVDLLPKTEDVAKALIEFMVTRKCRPLWSYEDITAKVQTIKSAEQLEHFLKSVVRVFRESVPLAHIDQRWAQVALQLALSCPSRHYAGRSFQVFRALHVVVSSQMLSDILPRLIDTVADPGEDMQGYVTEIMLTLEATVDNMHADFRPLDFVKELFLSTPNLNKEPRMEIRKSATVALRQSPPHHYRSTSYSISAVARRAIVSSPPVGNDIKVEPRHNNRCSMTELDARRNTNLSRSRSAQSLKNSVHDPQGTEDRLTILLQLFWIAVSLLESDYEYEFLLAVKFLEKLLRHIQPDRPECREKLDKIQQQIKWTGFPGVQALLLKGLTSPMTAEATWTLLSKLTLCMNAPVIDPSQGAGFPMNVIALLPYLVEHYEEPSSECSEAADHISQMCMEQSHKLDNLATIMQLYSRGTFGKDKFQWTKCVIKYLYDVYANLSINMIGFLVEVLDKGPATAQASILQILHCIVHYIDVTAPPFHSLNGELLRVVSKYVESLQWREALKILKLCVARSSSLTAPPPSRVSSSYMDSSVVSLGTHTSFAEADILVKKELPGRTMDFTFDMAQVNVIGQNHIINLDESFSEKETGAISGDPSKDAASITPSACTMETAGPPGWKSPHVSQKRTRERLVNLLNVFGQSGQIIGLRPSSSVIFSQSSDTMERQASKSTSSEEASLTDGIPGDDSSMERQLRVFDFLDDELERMTDGDQFNQGLLQRSSKDENMDDIERRSSPSSLVDGTSSDDEASLAQSVSPVEEYTLRDLATSSTITLQNTILTETERRENSISGSSHSIRSDHSEEEHSEVDISDLSPSNASPSFSNMTIVSIQSDEIEDVWRSHVHRVMTDGGATYAINTFHLFASLLQEMQRKLHTLTKEACYFLSRNEAVKSLAVQLSSMLDLLEDAIECPLVYADMETLIACKMVERHKFSILEINENYETYAKKKDHAAEVLDHLKSSVKMQSLRQNVTEMASAFPEGEEVELSMCWGLYHLHFQFLQLFESYTKLVSTLDLVPKPSEIVDLSPTVAVLRESLQRVQAELEQDNEAASMPEDASTLLREDAEKLLMECIRNEQLAKSIQLMHGLRKLFPGDMFGVNPSDEVEALLFIYCKCQADAKPGVVAIMESSRDLTEIHAHLIEIKIQLSSFPRSVTSPTPLAERGEPCGCPSGVSLMPTIIKVDSTESDTCPLIKSSESTDTLGLAETPDSSTL